VTISWPFDPSVDVGLVVLAVGYAWLSRRTNAPPHRAVFFALGLLVIWLALETPLDTVADHYLQSAHMAQHMLLITVAPPLLLLGLSPSMAAFPLRLPLLPRLTESVPALVVYAVVMIGWHLPPLFSLALVDPLVHVIEHVTFIGAGVVFWWPVIRATRGQARRPLDEPMVVLYLLAGMLPMMAVSLPLQFSRALFYPYYANAPRLVASISPVVDQTIAGAVMMLIEMVVTGIEAVIVISRWLGDAVRSDLQQRSSDPSPLAGEEVRPRTGGGVA
jgi:cytochrome c oxidase assembly factor CtaG